jgi:hypothetical protein
MFIILAWSLGMLNWNTVNIYIYIYQILWDIMRVWFVIYQIIQNVNHRGAGPPSAGETTPKVRQRIAKSLFASQNRHYGHLNRTWLSQGLQYLRMGLITLTPVIDFTLHHHITRWGKKGLVGPGSTKDWGNKVGIPGPGNEFPVIKISRYPAMIKGERQKSSSHWIGKDDRYRMYWNVHKANRFFDICPKLS